MRFKRSTVNHRGRPQYLLSRWSARSAAPFYSLFIIDLTVFSFFLTYSLSIPDLAYSPLEAPTFWEVVFDLLQTTHFAQAFTLSLGWFLALYLVPVLHRNRVITPVQYPMHFVILTFVACGTIMLCRWALPFDATLPPTLSTIVAPGILFALTHQIVGWVRTAVRPRRSRSMLLAPAGMLISLNRHLRQYERQLDVIISGVMRWDDHFPIHTIRLSDHFSEIVAAMRDCGASTLLLPQSTAASIPDAEDLRWLLETRGLHLDTVLEPIALGRHEADITVAPGIALLRFSSRQDTLTQAIVKRAFDLVVSTLLIVLLTPLWLILIIAIRLEDRGPAFFVQYRVGLGGRLFPMMKFRTMVTDAEKRLAELREQEKNLRGENFDTDNPDTGVLFKLKNDPRITRIGGFLRRTSIDELPQLFNVWLGHMSLVGPRPPLASEVEQYAPRVMRKFNVRPGITGLWQVSGRSNLSWTESVRLDLHYVENRSFCLDLKILLLTVKAVFQQDGAY